MKAIERIAHEETVVAATDWRKAMSDNVAIALIVYTGLNIFLTVGAIRATGMRSLSMVCLVVLVAGIVPACRKIEKRWREMTFAEAQARAEVGQYRRQQIQLWLLAIGLPFALTGLFRLLA